MGKIGNIDVPEAPKPVELTVKDLLIQLSIYFIFASMFLCLYYTYKMKIDLLKNELTTAREVEARQKETKIHNVSYPGARTNLRLETNFEAFEGYWDMDEKPEVTAEYTVDGKTVNSRVPPSTVSIRFRSSGNTDYKPPGIPSSIKGKHFRNSRVSVMADINFEMPNTVPMNARVIARAKTAIRYTVSAKGAYSVTTLPVEASCAYDIRTAAEAKKFVQSQDLDDVLKNLEEDVKHNKTMSWVFLIPGILFAICTMGSISDLLEHRKKKAVE